MHLKLIHLMRMKQISLDMTPFNHWVAYFQYHLKCQNFTDNKGDNEL